MKDTINALVELQRVDDTVRVFQLQRDELAANLERLQAIVGQMGLELAEKQEKLGEATRFYGEKQQELQADADRLAKAKARLGLVTRTKEYAAMQRELDNLRKKYSADEVELKRLVEAMEEYQTGIATQQAKLNELQAEVEREETTSADQLNELEGKISKIGAQRAEIEVRMDSSLLSRYRRVLKRREGKAVVPVGEGGKCTGCQMKLPPQMYIQVQRGESLLSCPSCQRYLFVDAYPEANFDLEGIDASVDAENS